MSETKKIRTGKELRDAENPYQRAAAAWVARRIGVADDQVYGVDFSVEFSGCETCGWEECALSYERIGGRGYKTTFDCTPGEFIEECVMILDEL